MGSLGLIAEASISEEPGAGWVSIILGNRTPGCVRGRLGNWPSYRDARACRGVGQKVY